MYSAIGLFNVGHFEYDGSFEKLARVDYTAKERFRVYCKNIRSEEC